MEMEPKYNPKKVEEGRYQFWLDHNYFKPSENKEGNIHNCYSTTKRNRKLHLGHAWDTTLQDILTRMKRMQGYDTLYLPGMDHAGIATQAKVEGKLRETRFNKT